jgi:hypothetical protein
MVLGQLDQVWLRRLLARLVREGKQDNKTRGTKKVGMTLTHDRS